MSRYLALSLLLTNSMFASFACNPGKPASPNAAVDVTPSVVDLDDEDTIPCAPRHVLQTVCQLCHQDPPVNGAPFPLVTRSNIVRVSPDGEIRQLMIEQLEVGRMPLAPVSIDDATRATLLEWLRAGAPADSPRACDDFDAKDGGLDAADAATEDATTDYSAENDDSPTDASAGD